MMAAMVKAAVAACPNSAVVMSGYSQGGQLVHKAAAMLDPATAQGVDAGKINKTAGKYKPRLIQSTQQLSSETH